MLPLLLERPARGDRHARFADGSAPDKCELRLLRPGEDEPVQTLVVSAQVRDAFDVRAEAYLPKPFSIDVLRDMLASHL